MRERLYRSRSDRMLFGVAGGMARWLDVDPSIVRLVWALLFFAGGVGLLLYVVAAIIVPEEPVGAPGTATGMTGDPTGTGDQTGMGPTTATGARHAPGATPRGEARSPAVIIGVVLVLLGVWFLARRYIPFLDPDLLWPAILIVLGILLVAGALRRSSRSTP